jgi:hypothetical protein
MGSTSIIHHQVVFLAEQPRVVRQDAMQLRALAHGGTDLLVEN